jgi:hypothetical protein
VNLTVLKKKEQALNSVKARGVLFLLLFCGEKGNHFQNFSNK